MYKKIGASNKLSIINRSTKKNLDSIPTILMAKSSLFNWGYILLIKQTIVTCKIKEFDINTAAATSSYVNNTFSSL